jgi:hypothetical protein
MNIKQNEIYIIFWLWVDQISWWSRHTTFTHKDISILWSLQAWSTITATFSSVLKSLNSLFSSQVCIYIEDSISTLEMSYYCQKGFIKRIIHVVTIVWVHYRGYVPRTQSSWLRERLQWQLKTGAVVCSFGSGRVERKKLLPTAEAPPAGHCKSGGLSCIVSLPSAGIF